MMKFLKSLWRTIALLAEAITRNGYDVSPVDEDKREAGSTQHSFTNWKNDV